MPESSTIFKCPACGLFCDFTGELLPVVTPERSLALLELDLTNQVRVLTDRCATCVRRGKKLPAALVRQD